MNQDSLDHSSKPTQRFVLQNCELMPLEQYLGIDDEEEKLK